MGATGWLIRRHLRQRRLALVPVALVVALGATVAFVAAGAADRTAGAYGRYLDRADVSDVVVNPSLQTTQIDQVMRNLEGVRSVTTDPVFFAGVDHDEGRPRTAGELNGESDAALVFGSTDGRYRTMDRPAMVDGRLPTGLNEVLVNEELAEIEGVGLGDTLPVSFWGRLPGTDLHPDFVEGDDVDTLLFPPLGVEQLTVVGIGTLADEVLPDELYPRDRIILSPGMTARYDCMPEAPPPDATAAAAFEVLVPEGCATSYRYYSLDIEGGAARVAPVMDDLLERASAMNAQVPPAIASEGAAYFPIITTTAQERERVERSIQPTVAALWVLSVVAAAVTVVVAGLAIARELRRSEDDLAQWWQLGLTTAERQRVVALPLLAAMGTGLVLALVAAWLLSPVGPVGSVRSIQPSPARQLSARVELGFVVLAVVAVAGTLLLAHVAAQRGGRPAAARPRRHPSGLVRLLPGSARPEVVEGIRSARTGYRGAGLVMASGGVAAATFLAAVVFGASLSSMVSTPAAYGWPWDVATMGGFGYGPTDPALVEDTLAPRADVTGWTVLGFTNTIAVDGDPVMSVIGFDRSSTVDLPVVDGRLPAAGDEVALGALTAADHDVGVGDQIELTGEGDRIDVTVTGLVVLPPLGPYQSDRAAPGTGMLIPEAMVPTDEDEPSPAAFVGIELVDGTDPRAVAGELGDDFRAWDTNGWTTFDYARPVRPPEIVDAGRMRAVPLLAGSLLVVAAVVGLALAVVLSVRGRRRELAILRALGFTGRQLRDSVRVQAVVTMAVALAFGVPLGIALGRLAWRAFADQLGVAAGPVVPVSWIAGTVTGGLVVALVAAAFPARTAARLDPATVLRSE